MSATLDTIVPAGAKLEKIASGFTWTEGPVWIHTGFLLFADIPANKIHKWSPGSTHAEPSSTPAAGKNPHRSAAKSRDPTA